MVGTLVGFAGTAVLARPGALGAIAWGGPAVLVATASWATGSLYSRRRPGRATSSSRAPTRCCSAAPCSCSRGLARGEAGSAARRRDAVGWLALAYLVTIGSLAGYTAYL